MRRIQLIALALTLLACPVAAQAAPRVFGFSPASLVSAIDRFNGEAIAHSSELGRAVKIRQGTVRVGRSRCASLKTDPRLRLTRIRVVDTAPNAASIVGSRSSSRVLGDALARMGAAGWVPPAVAARVRQPLWVVRSGGDASVEFVTGGFDVGDSTGGIEGSMAAETRMTFRVGLDVVPQPGVGAANLVLALTTEIPASRPGRRPKRRECLVVVPAVPVDVQALYDLLAAAPLASETRARLQGMLDEAAYWVTRDQPARAARSTRAFALEVARRSVSEVPSAHAEALIGRALAAVEALGF